jgi:7-dehydrocholesterol reductase
MALHNSQISKEVAIVYLIAGYVCIWVNYDADRQRAHVRATDGNCLIWGRKPEIIRATYSTESVSASRVFGRYVATTFACTIVVGHISLRTLVSLQGEKKKSILLVDGYWKVSRHFHYIPEILASFFWSVPAGFDHWFPFAYVLFLTGLLSDRGMCVVSHHCTCASPYRDAARMTAHHVVATLFSI